MCSKPTKPSIVVDKVSKVFSFGGLRSIASSFTGRSLKPNNSNFKALHEISFNVPRGESIGILGENGSGKSTLLQIISGTLQPTTGTSVTNGQLAALLELGSGFQSDFTGKENVYLNASILGLSKSRTDEILSEIIEFADIGDFFDRPVGTYSSGMRMRLAFAVNIFVEPDILIIDEALSVGDLFFRKKCFEILMKHISRNNTLLFVTHSEEQLRLFSSRVIVMHKGEIEFDGKPDDAINVFHEIMGERRRSYFSNISSRYSKNGITENHEYSSKIIKSDTIDVEGKNRNNFSYGEYIKISVSSNVNIKFKNIFIGILIRNKEGINVYSTETKKISFDPQNNELSAIHKDVDVEFEFQSILGRNSYFVEAYIINRRNDVSEKIDWVTNACCFMVDFPLPYEDTNLKGGVCDLKATSKVMYN
jgi:lipopolysaccharide transport system ATP-binding protein